MRMSVAQCELMPLRCPLVGKISALSGGFPGSCGLTAVTRLTDTGAEIATTPLFTIGPPLEIVTATNTVPVCVPTESPIGLAITVRSIPSGGSVPVEGITCTIHGSCGSSVAVKGNEPPMIPATCTTIGTSVLLPNGALPFGLNGPVTGDNTMRPTTE